MRLHGTSITGSKENHLALQRHPRQKRKLLPQKLWGRLREGTLSLLLDPGMFRGLNQEQHSEVTRLIESGWRDLSLTMLGRSVEDRALLPIGRDMARVVILDQGRIRGCPRTYVGLAQPSDELGSSSPDILCVSMVLKGGAKEANNLRSISGRSGDTQSSRGQGL